MSDVIQPVTASDGALANIKNSVKKLMREAKSVTSPIAEQIFEGVDKPTMEIFVFSLEKDLFAGTSSRILKKKLLIKDDTATVYVSKTKGNKTAYDEFVRSEITGLGVQIDHASVYGKRMELSFSEYKNTVWKLIDTGDFILVRTYLKRDEELLEYTLDEIIDGKAFENNEKGKMANIMNVDFAGVIINKEKNVGSTEQYRIEATDIIRMLQQINVSTAINEDDGWKASDTINLFFNSVLYLMDRENVKRIPQWSELSDKSDERVFWLPQDKIEEAVGKSNQFKTFNKILLTQIQETDTSHNQVILSIMATPVALVNAIFQYIFFRMGLIQFFEVDIDTQMISESYVKDSGWVYDKDKLTTPMTLLTAYFLDDAGKLDFTFEVPSDKQVETYLKFYTVNKVLSVIKILKEKDGEGEMKNTVFVPLADADKCVDDYNKFIAYNAEEMRMEATTWYTYVKRVNLIKWNNFFESLAGNRVKIRSAQFKKKITGEGEAIPLSQFIFHAYSLYNNTPVFSDVFRTEFERKNINKFKSYNYMYSTSQATWLTSAFVNDKNTFKFMIYPLITPNLYKNIPKYKVGMNPSLINKDAYALNKTMIMKTSEMLEYSFKQVGMARKQLYILTPEDVKRVSGKDVSNADWDAQNVEYVTLYEGIGDSDSAVIKEKIKKAPLRVDYQGNHSINMEEFDINVQGTLKPYVFDTINNHTTFENYFLGNVPHFNHVYRNTSGELVDSFGTTEFPIGSYSLVTSTTIRDAILNLDVEAYTDMKPFIAPAQLTVDGVDDENPTIAQVNKISQQFPLSFNYVSDMGGTQCVFKNQLLLDPSMTDTIADGLGLQLPYKLKLEFGNANNLTTESIKIPYLVAGVKSVLDVKKLESSVEFLLYKDLLPQQLLDNIYFKIRKVDTTGNLEDITNKEATVMNMDDTSKYLKAIITRIKDVFPTNNDFIPYEVYAYPNFVRLYRWLRQKFKVLMDVNMNVEDTGTSRFDATQTRLRFNELGLEGNDGWDRMNLACYNYIIDHMRRPSVLTPYVNELQEEIPFGDRLEMFTATMIEEEDDDTGLLFETLTNGVKHIMKILFSMETFVQDILRANFDNGSLYLPNKGYNKLDVGSYLYLIDDTMAERTLRLGAGAGRDYITTSLKKLQLQLKLRKAKDGETPTIKFEDFEEFILNTKNAIFVDSDDENMKPFGWFVWKTATYLGDASGGGGGTSGYTQKVYLARDGARHKGQYEEKNFIAEFVSKLNELGYDVISPEIFTK